MNEYIFRDYDIRGIADDDLTDVVVEKLGKGIGTYIQNFNGKDLIVGRDNRLSSKRIRDALIKSLLSTGCNIIDVGEVPTPIFYYSIIHYKKNGGVMITGSHNPPEFNGLKICKGVAPIFGKEIQSLRNIIESNKFKEGKGRLSEENSVPSYLDCLKERVNIKKRLKIVIDAGNGTTGVIAPKLFEELGCEVKPLYCEPDGNFPNHLPDPTVPEYLKDLIAKVKDEKANLGIGYDGDGDRIGAIDEQGNIVWGDKLLILFSRELLKKRTGEKIVFDVKSSQALVEDIKKHGGIPIMWKVGHSNIKDKMHKEKALLAGEMSGHMYFADNYFAYDDAIFASLRLVELLSTKNKPLSKLLKEDIPEYFSTREIRIPCSDQEKFVVVREAGEYFKAKYDTIDVDGVRILFGDGWGLLRASNTEPCLVVRFEAKTKEKVREIREIITDKMREFPSVDKDFLDEIIEESI